MIISSIMSLFAQLGHAYQSLCQYECKKALQLFNKLPKNHYSSGWVLSQCARALYEMTEYTQVTIFVLFTCFPKFLLSFPLTSYIEQNARITVRLQTLTSFVCTVN